MGRWRAASRCVPGTAQARETQATIAVPRTPLAGEAGRPQDQRRREGADRARPARRWPGACAETSSPHSSPARHDYGEPRRRPLTRRVWRAGPDAGRRPQIPIRLCTAPSAPGSTDRAEQPDQTGVSVGCRAAASDPPSSDPPSTVPAARPLSREGGRPGPDRSPFRRTPGANVALRCGEPLRRVIQRALRAWARMMSAIRGRAVWPRVSGSAIFSARRCSLSIPPRSISPLDVETPSR